MWKCEKNIWTYLSGTGIPIKIHTLVKHNLHLLTFMIGVKNKAGKVVGLGSVHVRKA